MREAKAKEKGPISTLFTQYKICKIKKKCKLIGKTNLPCEIFVYF